LIAERLAGRNVMTIEVEATYENGVLKLDRLLPLREAVRVTVIVKPKVGRVRQSAGLIPWTGDEKTLNELVGPDNHPWTV